MGELPPWTPYFAASARLASVAASLVERDPRPNPHPNPHPTPHPNPHPKSHPNPHPSPDPDPLNPLTLTPLTLALALALTLTLTMTLALTLTLTLTLTLAVRSLASPSLFHTPPFPSPHSTLPTSTTLGNCWS